MKQRYRNATKSSIVEFFSMGLLSSLVLFLSNCVVVPAQPSASPESNYQHSQETNLESGNGGTPGCQPNSPCDGETYSAQGKLSVALGACTKKACSPDNACCNSCQAEVSLNIQKSDYPGDFVGRQVVLQNHGCHANECGQLFDCNMSHGQLVSFSKNISTMECDTSKNCRAILSKPLGGKPPTVLDQGAPPKSENVTLYGKIGVESTCTLMGCPENNACCNSCSSRLSIRPMTGFYQGKKVLLEGHECKTDGCGKIHSCPLQADVIKSLSNISVTCDDEGHCTGRMN